MMRMRARGGLRNPDLAMEHTVKHSEQPLHFFGSATNTRRCMGTFLI
jgi:hypothetical protein